MHNLNQRIMVNLPFGAPPLPEQHRIVAKVDELTGLIDRLEATRGAREGSRIALRDSALAELRDADGAQDVAVAWARIAAHMDELFTEPEDVEPLRQAVLQLAVRGRLVRQEAGEEPAAVLLERIAAEKARLVREGKIRRPKALPPVGEEEVPFEVPEGWEWCRVGALLVFVTSGSRGWAKYYAHDGPAQFLRIGNLDYGTTELDLADVQRVAPPDNAEGRRTSTLANDILVSITGDTGMIGLVPDGLGEAYINQHIALCRPLNGAHPPFIATALLAPLVRGQLWSSQRGIKNSLGLEDIRCLGIPLPPLPEQHRIVAKVDELTGLIDRLEERLQAKRTAHETFAAAAVHHLDGNSATGAAPKAAQPARQLEGQPSALTAPKAQAPPKVEARPLPVPPAIPDPAVATGLAREGGDEIQDEPTLAVLAYLERAGGWRTKAEILAVTMLGPAVWPYLKRLMVEGGLVEQAGAGRGTRYRWVGRPKH